MKKAYTVTLEYEVIEKLKKTNPTINLSGLIRRLLKKHLEENKSE